MTFNVLVLCSGNPARFIPALPPESSRRDEIAAAARRIHEETAA